MKLVVIESPYAGDVALNLRYLRAALSDCVQRNESPYASHGLLTQPGVLRDHVPDERARGIQAGLAWGDRADVRAVYEDLGVTPGMLLGIKRANSIGQPVEMRKIPGWDRSIAATVGTESTEIRAALDAALQETYRDSRNSHAWAGTSDCVSHNEGLACCVDPNHDRYRAMLDVLALRVAKKLPWGLSPALRTFNTPIRPGDEVELVARTVRTAGFLKTSPQVGDRGRVVRVIHHLVDGEPVVNSNDDPLVHVLLAGQDQPIGFEIAELRVVGRRATPPSRALPALDEDSSDPAFDSDQDDGGD